MVGLENVALTKISRHRRTVRVRGTGSSKFTEMEGRREGGGQCLMGTECLGGTRKPFWIKTVVMATQCCECV